MVGGGGWGRPLHNFFILKIRLPQKFHCPKSLGSALKVCDGGGAWLCLVCKPTLVFRLCLLVELNNYLVS